MIVGQNALLNQYVPTFYIKNLVEGQGLIYDSSKRAFVNAFITGGGIGPANPTSLGQLTNVSSTVDNVLGVNSGEALVYNALTMLWENKYVDFNTLLNKPTNSSYSFIGLSDTAKPSVPHGYVKWNTAGTQLIYSTTISASDITGLATVATTGNYNDLTNKPTFGSVTSVSVVDTNGIVGIVTNPTTTPSITIALGDITPTSVVSAGAISGTVITATGNITGLNLSGTNTGDQTITLTGDVTGTGTDTFATTLSDTAVTAGTYGTVTSVPQITIDSKGRITGAVNVPISTSGLGTVTDVSVTPSDGVLASVTNSTTTPQLFISLGDITPLSVVALGNLSGANLSGTNTGDQTITLTGDVLGSGTGSFTTDLSVTGVTAGSYGSSTQVPAFTVDAKGRISSVTNTDIVVTLTGDVLGSGTGSFATSLSVMPNVDPGQWGDNNSLPIITVDDKGRITDITEIAITPANIGALETVNVVSNEGITSLVDDSIAGVVSITLGLGDITPTSVSTIGTIAASNFSGTHSGDSSGTNTGDQTITLTGDVTGSGTGIINASLRNIFEGGGTYGNSTNIPVVTFNSKGLIVAIDQVPISAAGFGTVTSVSVTGQQGVSALVTNATTTPDITIGLGDIIPTSVAAVGTVTGSNLSGTNTGDQTITLSGDATGSGTGAITLTLSDTTVVANTYGSATQVPVFTVDSKGRITGVTNTDMTAMGTVTSVAVTANNGITVSGSPITDNGTFVLGLGDIQPNSVVSVGIVAGSNLSGTNTGDQTIDLTGDVTGTGTGSFVTTLSTVNLDVGTFGSDILVPQITVDAKGRITAIVNVPISTIGTGSVTDVSGVGISGVTVSVTNPTTTPEITVGLGDITPTSVAATGTVTGSNLSGTNTGDQTITLTGDASGSGTGTFPMTLNTVNLAPGVYGDSHFVPTVEVNNKGLVTSVTTQHVDTTVRDLVEVTDTIVIAPRHQYIVTSQLEVEGYIVNNGVIAIL